MRVIVLRCFRGSGLDGSKTLLISATKSRFMTLVAWRGGAYDTTSCRQFPRSHPLVTKSPSSLISLIDCERNKRFAERRTVGGMNFILLSIAITGSIGLVYSSYAI